MSWTIRTLALICALWASAADSACRHALALGLDVSGSVDAQEYRLQLDGLANALLYREVQQAFLALPGTPVRLYIYQWAGPGDQQVLLDWTDIDTADDLFGVAKTLRFTRRTVLEPTTALGEAMQFGWEALSDPANADCWRRTLDVSGDGKANAGTRPLSVKNQLAFSPLIINGLVIGADAPTTGDLRQMEIAELSTYYRREVLLGDQAFLEVALGFEDFEAAMARKLLKELEVLAVSEAGD